MAITCVGGVAHIGSRSHLTKIVDRNEIGKVLSFMLALDTLAPMISSTLLAYIFKYTIDTYPGAVYEVIAFLLFIPIFIMIWIDLFTQPPLLEEHTHNKGLDENENDKNYQANPGGRDYEITEQNKKSLEMNNLSEELIFEEIMEVTNL